MVSAPKLSQTTAIAKATTTANQLAALLPTVASEYSPVRVYIPGAETEINQLGGDTSSSTGNVWIAPDANGDGSSYTATIECLGAGGSGGGGLGRRSPAPFPGGDINYGGSAATTRTMSSGTLPVPTLNTAIQGGTVVVVVAVPNNTSQTMTVTDTAGNNYTLLKSETGVSGRGLYAFAATNIAQLNNSTSTIKVTSTVSEVMCVSLYYLPDVHGISTATPTSTSIASVAANTAWPSLSLNYNKNDLVMSIAASNVAPPTTASGDFTLTGTSNSTSTAQFITVKWTQRGYVPGDSAGGSTLAPTTWSSGNNGSAATGVAEMHLAFPSTHVYASDLPGSGAGGGEYACEPNYPIVPGKAYSYFAGTDTTPAYGATDGNDGQPTVFDPNGKGFQGGVVANGGGAGRYAGTSGLPGTGSDNSIHYDGGSGGYSPAGVASDYPPAYLFKGIGDLRVDLVLDDTARSPQDSGINTLQPQTHQAVGAYVGPATGGVTAPPQVAPSGLSDTAAGTAWEFARGTSATVAGGVEVPNTSHSASTSTVIGDNNGGGNAWSTFSVSAWIRGHATATSPNDWSADAKGKASICGTANLCAPGGNVFLRGFSLYMDTASSSSGGILNFGYGESTTASLHTFTMAGTTTPISATDGKWHHVMFISRNNSALGSGSAMYIDGVLVNSSSSYVGQGSGGYMISGVSNFTLGYLLARGDCGYKGYMSSVWLGNTDIPSLSVLETPSTTTAPSYIVGLSTTTGGAGGGSSAGSPGAGTAGSNGVGSTGGTGGPIGTNPLVPYLIGQQPGTSGNNAGTAGNAGTPTANGSGGGGAGSAGSYSASVYTLNVPVQKSATYNGMDSSSAGAIYSTSDNEWQPSGTTAPEGVTTGQSLCIAGGRSEDPSSGTMNSILQFPYLGNQQTADGSPLFTTYSKWQAARLTLNLTINSTQASIMGFSIADTPGDIPEELTDTELYALDNSANPPTYDLYFYVPAGDPGRTVSFELPASITGDGNPTSVIVGVLAGSVANSALAPPYAGHDFGVGGYTTDEATDWYCEFFGSGTDGGLQDAYLTIEYFLLNNAANYPVVQSNGGGAGRIAITIPDPEGTPVTTILPTAATDTAGNALAAGITTSAISTWQPGSSPLVVEYVHYVGNAGEPGFSTGWSNSSTATALRFELTADGTVHISGQIKNSSSISGNVTIFTLPSGYFSTTSNTYLLSYSNSGTTYLLVILTTGVVELFGISSTAANTPFNINSSYSINN